jgi:hypothetical protein
MQLIHLNVTKEPGDFVSDAHTAAEAEKRFVDFFFNIPHTKTVSSSQHITSPQSLPSSTLVQASKYITNHTALSDRRVIQGICDVSYQVGARFLLRGLTVFQTYCPVELSSLPDPQASLTTQMLAKEYRSVARTAILHRPWRRGKGDLWVSILEPEPVLWRSGVQQTCHPINLCVKLSTHQSAKVALRPIECSAQARWEAILRFSVVAESNNDSIASSSNSTLGMSKTVVLKSQDAKLLFPPWYQIAGEEGKSPTFSPAFLDDTSDDFYYAEAAASDNIHSTTMTTLALIPPQLNMGPTFSISLMSMKYIIDVTLSVKDPQGSGRNLSSEFRIPISLSSSETNSTALKGEPWSRQRFNHHEIEDIVPPQYIS